MSEIQNLACNCTRTNDHLEVTLDGILDLYTLPEFKKKLELQLLHVSFLHLDFNELLHIDTACAIYINNLQSRLEEKGCHIELTCKSKKILQTLETVHVLDLDMEKLIYKEPSLLEKIGKDFVLRYKKFVEFLGFFGQITYGFFYLLKRPSSLRIKEIFFEINENAIKAFSIVALTSFLVGVVTAYQSSVQLKIYGANIFIVDMLGISIFRELAPLLTAIVIAGRSGSSFTAQIGAMKITEELDAMRTMGFDPIRFLVLPRIIALMIMMPLLIFVSDIAGLVGGMLVAKLDLSISVSLFLDRLNEVVVVKHFFVGIAKGPFFAFLIASIGIFRGMMVKDDTQSIGINTTKSVVEAIFAVIVCDAVFSIIFTNLGI
jgi:phospholipid/cholesterol/gamma-HCH transport system permease protein